MKANKLFIGLFFSLFLFVGCSENAKPEIGYNDEQLQKLYQMNDAKVTVSQGLSGTLTMKEGNCMPIIDPENTTCKEYPIEREIRIYPYLKIDELKLLDSGFYETDEKAVAVVHSDKNGFFQVQLPVGEYSCLVIEKGHLYCHSFDGVGGVNPFTVTSGNVLKWNLRVDYAVY